MTDDKLRAAILAADALHIENHGESCDCDVATYLDPLAALASVPDEGPLPAGHPDTWPGGTMHMPTPAQIEQAAALAREYATLRSEARPAVPALDVERCSCSHLNATCTLDGLSEEPTDDR